MPTHAATLLDFLSLAIPIIHSNMPSVLVWQTQLVLVKFKRFNCSCVFWTYYFLFIHLSFTIFVMMSKIKFISPCKHYNHCSNENLLYKKFQHTLEHWFQFHFLYYCMQCCLKSITSLKPGFRNFNNITTL